MESTDRICHRRLGDRRGAQTQNGSVKGIATPFQKAVWGQRLESGRYGAFGGGRHVARSEPKVFGRTRSISCELPAIQEQLPERTAKLLPNRGGELPVADPDAGALGVLAVLLDDSSAALPILQTLWDASEAEARRISKRSVDLSLTQIDGAGESIRLHDLQLDYVRVHLFHSTK